MPKHVSVCVSWAMDKGELSQLLRAARTHYLDCVTQATEIYFSVVMTKKPNIMMRTHSLSCEAIFLVCSQLLLTVFSQSKEGQQTASSDISSEEGTNAIHEDYTVMIQRPPNTITLWG